MKNTLKSIGVMSGTSLDGLDIAMIESDGQNIIKNKKFSYFPYTPPLKQKLHDVINLQKTLLEIKVAEKEFTLFTIKCIKLFLAKNKIANSEIDVIAFHGQTIIHNAKEQITWQIGNVDLIEKEFRVRTIKNFRTFDIANGGQGAPLVPIYHFYMIGSKKAPYIVLNIGGISNITYVKNDSENDIQAFDFCFGNAPSDDIIKDKTGKNYDKNGELAKKGKVNIDLADKILRNNIFNAKPPKSFDRDDFKEILAPVNKLDLEDALATFAYMHAKALLKNLEYLSCSKKIKAIYICGGGKNNLTMINEMKKWINYVDILPVEELGLNGDAIEAEAFAFLAIRMKKGLAISYQKTTGISPGSERALAFSL